MGGLGSSSSLKMGGGGFQSGHSREKHGILELKITKKCLFFKTMVFSICPSRKSGTKNCIFFKRGSFGAAQVEKVESLVSAKAEKCVWGGGFRAAHTRTVLIWEYPPGGLSLLFRVSFKLEDVGGVASIIIS